MLSVAVSLVGGLLFGYLFLDTGVKDTLDLILMSALDVMIFIAAIFVNNIVLSQFLGICPFLGVSKKISIAFGAYRRAECV